MNGFVHDIDPVIAEVGGLYLWWYGAAYTVGLIGIFLWLRHGRERLSLSLSQVYDLTIILALSVLIGGRLVEVSFYEWSYYSHHPFHLGAYWLGGMSTHGILGGCLLGLWLFAHRNGSSFWSLADELVIPGAFLMGVGRIGNFIDGQIIGAPTQVWWAVKFPDIEGFRHPVVLYDGLKNLLLVPLLLLLRLGKPAPGVLSAHFLFWYGILRFFTDQYREYRVSLFGLGPGQGFNLLMALAGLFLLWWHYRRAKSETRDTPPDEAPRRDEFVALWPRRVALALLVLFPLVIPSDWTQDVPQRYGHRHPGMEYSILYPPIDPVDK